MKSLVLAKAEDGVGPQADQIGVWAGPDLALRRRRDPSQVEIAMRLRKETTLSVKEIAARLHLGTPASASLCLLAAMRKTPADTPAQGYLGI